MKKILKKLTTLTLSLVMIFGTIPCFTNVVGATGASVEIVFSGISTNIYDYKLEDAIPLIGVPEPPQGDEVFAATIYDKNGAEVTDKFTKCGEYYAYLEMTNINLLDYDSFTFGGEELTLSNTSVSNIDKDTKKYYNDKDNQMVYAYLGFEITPRPIDEIEILDNGTFDSLDFTFKAPNDANYVISTYNPKYWHTDSDCTDEAKSIEDGKVYYTKLKITPNSGYIFDAPIYVEVENGYMWQDPTYSESEITVNIAKTTKGEGKFDFFYKNITSKVDMIEVGSEARKTEPDESIIKINKPENVGSIYAMIYPGYEVGKNYVGQYVFCFSLTMPENDMYNKAYVASIDKITFDGNTYSVRTLPRKMETREEIYEYVFGSSDNIAFESRSNSKFTGERFNSNLRPTVGVFKVLDFSNDNGYVNFQGMNIGNSVKDITASGNIGDDIVELNVYEYNDGSWGDPLGVDAKLEEGKQYKINYSVMHPSYEFTKIKINGTNYELENLSPTYPEENGYNYMYNAELNFCSFVTYKFTAQSRSSGGSKKYKAVDTKDNVEKISGSGKKGSTRTITLQEGRKLTSVVVTDKDGNKIDVTMNEDGTYSFVQPASNVDVQVNYKNREITLNIGSTEASVDDEKTNLDVCPVIRNDRTMLPIRFVAENLGAKVEWNELEPNMVYITRGDIKIEIKLGSNIAKVNGKEYELDSVAFAENDRTYLPVRFVSEALNAIVEWNESKPNEVKIYEQ